LPFHWPSIDTEKQVSLRMICDKFVYEWSCGIKLDEMGTIVIGNRQIPEKKKLTELLSSES